MVKTTYSPDQATLYDLAMMIYHDHRGVVTLLNLNQLDFTSPIAGGTPIKYDDSVTFAKVVIVSPPKKVVALPFITRNNQSAFDLAIQMYGSVQQINNIIGSIVTDLNSPAQQGISIPPTNTSNLVWKNIFSKKVTATFQ